jgi:imidazolonepropionase-like amidohydrolase
MRSRLSLVLILLLLTATSCGSYSESAVDPTRSPLAIPAGATVIRNATIIDGSGVEPLPAGIVAFQDDEIIAVGPEAQFQIPEDIETIDGQGGTILPGFIDAHTHIMENSGSLQSALNRWLQSGVTTMRDLGSRYGSSDNSLPSIADMDERLAVSDNNVPTILIAGPILTAPGGYPTQTFPTVAREVNGEDGARQTAEELLGSGADLVKIAVGEGAPTDPKPTLSLLQIRAISAAAQENGARVSAHVTRVEEAALAVEGNVDDLAHSVLFGRLSDDLIQRMVEQDVAIVSTLVVEDNVMRNLPLSEEQSTLIEEQRRDNLSRFIEAGGRYVMGSDFGNPGIRPGMPLQELQRMIEMGMTSMEVILAATSHAAHVVGRADQIGRLEAGKKADIIAVKGNPIDDIQAMEDVIVVIKNGEIIVRP